MRIIFIYITQIEVDRQAESRSQARQPFDLTGAVALITGGGTGLGRAIALGLANAGARVVITGRRERPLDEVVKEIRSIGGEASRLVGDVSRTDTAEKVVAQATAFHDRLDVLVNCAGVTVVKPSLRLVPEEWDRIVDTNLKGPFFYSVAAARRFIDGFGGVILNVASIGAIRGGAGVYTAYSASKGGLVSMTRSLASEWAEHGIRVNCIAAGAFRTDMSRAAYEDAEILARYVKRIPLGRTAEPHEISPLALYLCSDSSSFVTGELFVIDGGQSMR